MRQLQRLFLLFCLLAALPISASERKMLGAHEQKDWQAVGRLNLGDGFCSAALIGADLLVTAAHCLYAPRTGARRLADRVHFVAGYRLRRHQGHAQATKITLHPDYTFAVKANSAQISTDLALVRLNKPFPKINPFRLAPDFKEGEGVAIVSYGRDRPEIPSIQSPCLVEAILGAVAVLDCDATYGVSGAPVFRQIDGEWRIAAVISAIGDYNGGQKAFAVILGAALGPLLLTP